MRTAVEFLTYQYHPIQLPRTKTSDVPLQLSRHRLPRHLTPIISIEFPTPLQPMHHLQHAINTLLGLQHCPRSSHPRLDPPGIHTDDLDAPPLQRRLADTVRRTLARPLATRAQARTHIHHHTALP